MLDDLRNIDVLHKEIAFCECVLQSVSPANFTALPFSPWSWRNRVMEGMRACVCVCVGLSGWERSAQQLLSSVSDITLYRLM